MWDPSTIIYTYLTKSREHALLSIQEAAAAIGDELKGKNLNNDERDGLQWAYRTAELLTLAGCCRGPECCRCRSIQFGREPMVLRWFVAATYTLSYDSSEKRFFKYSRLYRKLMFSIHFFTRSIRYLDVDFHPKLTIRPVYERRRLTSDGLIESPTNFMLLVFAWGLSLLMVERFISKFLTRVNAGRFVQLFECSRCLIFLHWITIKTLDAPHGRLLSDAALQSEYFKIVMFRILLELAISAFHVFIFEHLAAGWRLLNSHAATLHIKVLCSAVELHIATSDAATRSSWLWCILSSCGHFFWGGFLFGFLHSTSTLHILWLLWYHIKKSSVVILQTADRAKVQVKMNATQSFRRCQDGVTQSVRKCQGQMSSVMPSFNTIGPFLPTHRSC